MDGSITSTLAALLVLCALAPASQQSVLEQPDEGAVQFDTSLVPAASLSLALHGTGLNDADQTPGSSASQTETAKAAPITIEATAFSEEESAEAEPITIATAEQTGGETIPSAESPSSEQVSTEPEAQVVELVAPGNSVDADPSAAIAIATVLVSAEEAESDPLLNVTEVSAAEAFLDEQGGAEMVTELLEAAEPALPVAEVDEAEAVAVLESAVDKKQVEDQQAPFEMLDSLIQAGTMKRLTWNATEAFSGTTVPTPILVAHGAQTGPTLCLTAAVHGDELNGIETVRRVIHDVAPEKLNGTLIGVPIVNMAGFQRHSRYLPDRRDLNRFFPGHPRGSSASRIAYSFFKEVIVRCDGLVDLHTGSFHRTNLPQLRANLNNDAVVKLTEGFGSTIILHSDGGVGTLRRAAVEAGIPAVTLEAGEPLRLQGDEVRHSVKGIYTLLETLGMYDKRGIRGGPEPVYYTSEWVRADTGGILFSSIKLGKRIKRDDLLGTVTDPISNEQEEIRSPYSGRVIGMALNQFVMPGFATYHIGIEAETADEAKQDEDPVILSHDVAFEPELEVVE
ncbi:MAG: succinylglutamate desuccinylase [Pseudomonadales bacterium]